MLNYQARYRVAVSALALSLASSLPARAQATNEAADEALVGEIIVTAQKREESANKVGMSITALSGDSLLEKGVIDVADLGRVVPGFTFTSSGLNTPVYTIRGIGFFERSLSATPAVTVYTDEIPLPFPAMTKGAVFDIERVEVLKGPQGTLFGQNSTGGAINYINAKPTDELSAGAEAGYGRFNSGYIKGFVSGPLSDTLQARLAVNYTHNGDWQKSYTRNDVNGRVTRVQARWLLDWQPTERLAVKFNINGWKDTGTNQAPQLLLITPQNPAGASQELLNYPIAPRNNRAADWDPGFMQKRERFYQGAIRADYDLSDTLKLTSISSYLRYVVRADSDESLALPDGSYSQRGHINTFVQELRLAGDLGWLRWIIGGNYQRDKTVDDASIDVTAASTSNAIPGLAFSIVDTFSRQNITTKAAFGNLSAEVVDGITLQAGGRYTASKRFGDMCTSGDANFVQTFAILSSVLSGRPFVPLPAGGCVSFAPVTFENVRVTGTLKEDNFSWRAGANWQATPQLLLYANVSRGYKSGNYPASPSSLAIQYNPVTQESVLAYEAGFKATITRRAQFNAAAFYYDYTDKQLRSKIADPIFGAQDALQNIPEGRIWGLEGQLQMAPIKGLDVSIGGAYVDSKVEEFAGISQTGTFQDFAGAGFPYTPKVQLTGDIQYSWGAGSRLHPFVGASARYNSKTNSSLGEEQLTSIKGYTLFDFRAGAESSDQRWRAAVLIKNVFNTYYWDNVLRQQDATVRYTGMPRTYGFSLGYRF